MNGQERGVEFRTSGSGEEGDRSITDLQEQKPHLLRATPSDLDSCLGYPWPAPLRKHPSDRYYCNPEVIH